MIMLGKGNFRINGSKRIMGSNFMLDDYCAFQDKEVGTSTWPNSSFNTCLQKPLFCDSPSEGGEGFIDQCLDHTCHVGSNVSLLSCS